MSERHVSVDRLRHRHRRVALDANVLIYLLEGTDLRGDLVADIVDACDDGLLEAAASTIAMAEVLTGPARSGDGAAFERLVWALRELPMTWVAPDPEIAADAAWYRGRTNAALGDAFHVATARATGATAFVTNDRATKGATRLEVVYLDALATG